MTVENRSSRPRRWPLALVAFLFSPLAAYLYVGRPRRALALAVVLLAMLAALRNGLGGWLAEPPVWLAFAGLAVAVYLVALGDALRIAWGARDYRLQPWNRWWAYLLAALASYVATEVMVNPALGGFLAVRPFSTPSASMAPTLRVGDLAVADMRAYERAAPEPGDIVVFDRFGDGKEMWVKRVVAGPGDKVAIVKGVVIVNGAPARQDPVGGDGPPKRAIETLANGRAHMIELDEKAVPALDDMAERTAPPDAYFVLGDNRGNSLDSRFAEFGCVPRARILGRMAFVYWSRDRGRIGTRLP
jgi:signal peptidase I